MQDVAGLFELLLGDAGLPAALTRTDGAVLAANAAFARRLGRPEAWRPDGLLHDLAAPDLADRLQAAVARAAAAPGRELRVEGEFEHGEYGRLRLACHLSAVMVEGRCAGVLHRLRLVAPAQAADGEKASGTRAPGAPPAFDRHGMLETLVEGAPVALFQYRADPDGRASVPLFNASTLDLFGVSAEALERDGGAVFTHVPADDLKMMADVIARTSRTLQTGTLRYRIAHPTRGLRHVIGEGRPMRLPEGGVIWHCVAFDVTREHEAELRARESDAALALANQRLARIALVAPVGLYEFRSAPDGSWSFPYLSPPMKELLGVEDARESLEASAVFDLIVPGDVPDIAASIERSGRTGERWTRRMRVRHPQRGLIWVRAESLPQADPDGGVTWTGAIYDVSEDVRREAELAETHARADAMRAENERQALQDGLTGLPNRRAYDRAFAERIARARDGSGAAEAILVRLDLDHFKAVNDTLGHAAGDRVLLQVAQILRQGLRGGDFAARIGGDEFSILLAPDATPELAERIVERIQEGLAEPLMHDGRPCRFGASFGLAHTEELGEVGAELQVFADAALYRAKESGRSRLELFTPELHRGILADRRMAMELQDALERDEFVPFFQPQVRARDRSLYGAEVLLRWRHPRDGLLAPPAFLRLADQLRLSPSIDRRVMERTQEVLAAWAEAGFVPPRLSFNMSAGRIRDPDVVETARRIADGPTRIAMELLESTLVEEEGDVFRFNLDELREAGIAIEIDDFGSGHASIVGLTQVAPDVLKIDRRLVAPAAEDRRSRRLVQAILEIARTLGISTIAEGIESEAHARALAELGCDVLQGYHFGAPMEADAFLAFAQDWVARVA